MAQQQAAHHLQQQQQQSPSSSPLTQPSPQPQLTGLASGLRPHYFAKSPTLSAILGGKSHHAGAYPSPPPSPPTSGAALRSASQFNQQASSSSAPTPQQAVLASIASQTLLGKLGSAFWDAFSGSGAGPNGPAQAGARSWDADKVRRVLEGKAVVRVVDVEPVPAPAVEKIASSSSSSARTSVVPPAARLANNLSEKPAKGNASLVDMLGSLRI